METVLFKYESLGNDYLICDTGKNDVNLSTRAIRSICARNFGVGSTGLVAGRLTSGNRGQIRMYSPLMKNTIMQNNCIMMPATICLLPPLPLFWTCL